MPTQLADLYPTDQLNKDFQNLVSKPFDDAALEFEVLMPKGWKMIPVKAAAKADTKVLVPLLRIQDVVGDKFAVAIEAKYIVLEHFVRPRDWLECFLLACKYEAIKFQEGVYFGRPTADCLATFTLAKQKYIARMMAFRDGDRIFLAAGFGLEADYRKFAKEIATSLMGFGLKAPLGSKPVEELLTYSVSYPASLKMQYPRSWLPLPITKVPLGISALDLFTGEPDKPSGLIRVRAFSKAMPEQPTVEKVVESFFRELGDPPDFAQEKIVLDEAYSVDRFPSDGKAMLVKAKSKGVPVEIQLHVMSDNDIIVAVGLINAREDTDRQNWMINRGAFATVLDSMSR